MSSKPNKNSVARLHPLTEPVLYGFVPVPPLLPHYGRGTTEVSASPAPPPHQVYFEVRGNLAGMPLLLFHGGPGYYCVPEDAQFFDPSVFCVISFDQRGSGKSTPPAHEGCWNAYESLSIDVLVADAELVRGHVMKEIQQMVLKKNAASSKKLTAVAGGKSAASSITTGEETQASSRAAARQCCVAGWSWGSAMALCYAETFPQHTADIILQGVYLGSMQEHAPQFQIGSAAAAAAAATMTIGAVSPSTSSVAMMKKERRNAAYREAFELFSQQVEVAVAARRIDGVASTPSLTLSKEVLSVAAQGGSEPASPSPSPSSSLSNWVDDPFLLHSLYRDYILSFVPLQQAALDEYNNSNINKTSGATDDDDELLQRKKRLSRTVALHPLEGKPYATFSVPDNGQPCVCNDQADNNDDYHRNNTPKQLCCMERAHRALAMWSLYENFLTYPTEQTYYLDKMRVAADMRKPYRASHKDITGALMQLFIFPSMMARGGGGKAVRDGALLPVILTSNSNNNNNNVVSGGGSVKSGVVGCTCGTTVSADASSSKPCTTTTMSNDQHQQHQQQHALWCRQVLARVITPPSSSSRPYRKMWVVHGADDEVCPPFAAEALASIAASLSCHPKSTPTQKPEERGQKQQQKASASCASGKKKPSKPSKSCNLGASDDGNACSTSSSSNHHRSKVVKLWLVDDASHDSLDGGAMEDAFLRFAEEMAEDVVDRWL